jgi:hypothetical protein
MIVVAALAWPAGALLLGVLIGKAINRADRWEA